ncbi:MAG: hypothetical protein LBU91_05465 [Bacteroidales bacterium]|nr:hypothetical protein [Bacteroidales bacterium]
MRQLFAVSTPISAVVGQLFAVSTLNSTVVGQLFAVSTLNSAVVEKLFAVSTLRAVFDGGRVWSGFRLNRQQPHNFG